MKEHGKIGLIIGIFVLFSMFWIYVSDEVLYRIFLAPQQRVRISIYKGWVFIILSAGILYPLILRLVKEMHRAGEALRKSEGRFRLMADSMPNFVFSVRPDGTIDNVNRGFREYTGLANHIGIQEYLSVVHPDDRQRTLHTWELSLARGESYEIEHRFRRWDGVFRWFLCRMVSVRSASGEILHWYGTSTDIDDLKSANERIRRILDSTSDGFIAIDSRWQVTYYNRKAEETSGMPAEQMVGSDYWEINPQALGTRIEAEYRLAMKEKKSVHFEEYFERYGKLLDVFVHPYADGIAIFFRDLSHREEAAQALHARTAELESLLLHAPIGFAFFDREHRYLRVNRALAEINGLSEQESLGRTVREILPENARSVDPIIDQVFETGQAVEAEIAGETPKEPGVTRHWLTGFFPVFGAGYEILATGAYVVEISDRKRSEEAMARLGAIVAGAEDAIFSEDLDGVIQTWNRGAERLYGYPAKEIIGKNVSVVVPAEARQELENVVNEVKRGAHQRYETTRLTKAGQHIYISLTVSPIMDAGGRIVGVSKIAHDISHRKQVEENLKETVKTMQRAIRDLQQFAYVASHDLQEPLRDVTRYVDMLAFRYRDRLDEKANRYIGFAVEGATRIQTLINDLLAFSEVGAKAREFSTVSMDRIAEEAADSLKHQVKESHAEIIVDPLPEVQGDRTQLMQLLQQLLGNALKFSRKDRPPRIRVCAEKSGREWIFGIHDNGIGIAPEYLQKIFVIFQRLHSRAEYPGTGIGLAICRKIVEWHGGRIWATSAPSAGSSFYFTIPTTKEGKDHGDTAG